MTTHSLLSHVDTTLLVDADWRDRHPPPFVNRSDSPADDGRADDTADGCWCSDYEETE